MAHLHQRGIDLMLNVQSALDHAERLSVNDVRALLKETEVVLRELLARDSVQTPADTSRGPATRA